MISLPEPYVECVIKHIDGGQRIGRLNHRKTHFQLSSFEMRKVEVVWAVSDVVACKPVDFFPID